MNKHDEKTEEGKIFFNELSAFEAGIILVIRDLKPFERIEIRYNDSRVDEILVIKSSTVREVFKRDVV
jgi:hypothetical protein